MCRLMTWIMPSLAERARYLHTRDQLSLDVEAMAGVAKGYIAERYPVASVHLRDCSATAIAVFNVLTNTEIEKTCVGVKLIAEAMPPQSMKPTVVYVSLTGATQPFASSGHRFIILMVKGRVMLLQACKGLCLGVAGETIEVFFSTQPAM